MKPRIFIGSSFEGKHAAYKIKDLLSDVADCNVWDENFFGNNRSSFEALNENSTLFHFAILVATADDVQLKRGDIELIARDNVVFEFGLYIGRLGRNRSFLVKEKKVQLPTDMKGITVQEYKSELAEQGYTLEEVCEKLKIQIIDTSGTYELSFVPSTALAFGYFENFLSSVSRELMDSSKRKVDDKNYKDFELHVILPDELPNNFNDQVKNYLHHKNLKEMEVHTSTRKFNFYLDYAQDESEVLKLYDLPTAFNCSKNMY